MEHSLEFKTDDEWYNGQEAQRRENPDESDPKLIVLQTDILLSNHDVSYNLPIKKYRCIKH